MKKLLVLVDYQKDFVDGSLGFPAAKALEDRLVEWLMDGLLHGYPIAVTMDTHTADYLETREGRLLPVKHCIAGSPGHGLYGKVRELVMSERDSFTILQKEAFGVDPRMLLHYFGHLKDIEEVEFAGLDGNICVLSNICCFQALFPEARMVLDASLTSSSNMPLLVQTLNVLKNLQVEIRNPPKFLVTGVEPETGTQVSYEEADLECAMRIGASLLTSPKRYEVSVSVDHLGALHRIL